MSKDNLSMKKWVTPENIIKLLIFAGCVLRIWYAVVTPVTVRAHDIIGISTNSVGKASYLLRLAVLGKLPDSYDTQFYQQPFYFLLSAFVAKVMQAVTGIGDAEFLVNAGKIVSCAASCFSLYLSERLLREFCLARTRVFGMVILSFTPVFWLTGGRLGEDALTFFFMVAVILVTIYWEKTPDWKYTILLAILYGCGMMTKVSLAFPSFYTAYIFWKNRKSLQFVPKMLVFAIIAFPLGMWYSIRNFVLFGQPIGYVMVPDAFLYRGMTSYVARFFSIDVRNWLRSPYANPLRDYNFPVYLLKTELFGEFSYDMPIWIPAMLLLISTVLTLLVAAVGIFKICKWKSISEDKRPYILGLLFGGYAAISYFSLPYGCSMDFRYYLMLTVCKAMVLCRFLEEEPHGTFAQEQALLQKGMKWLCILFGIFSIVFFTMI